MSVPDYQSLMRPTLEALADGQSRTTREVLDTVAGLQMIDAEDRAELLPSGKQTIFTNRVGWALTYMAKAGVVTRPRRGVVQITDRAELY